MIVITEVVSFPKIHYIWLKRCAMKKVNFLWAAISLVLVSAIGFTGLLTSCSFFMFGTSNAEKLGFPKGKKVLLLHMDDAGMCEEANEAVRYYIENGYLQSASSWKPANKPGVTSSQSAVQRIASCMYFTFTLFQV